ncbi:MAG: formate dehydrogenase accessory sulfurtransferase FdhD [Nitriliruptoraceae bacterium]
MEVTGAVLAGGRSRRMGLDKAQVPIEGVPLLERTLSTLAVITDDLIVVGPTEPSEPSTPSAPAQSAPAQSAPAQSAPTPSAPTSSTRTQVASPPSPVPPPALPGRPPSTPSPGFTRIADLRADSGPLAGIETALSASRHDVVLVVAVDHPWLAPDVLKLMINRLLDNESADVVMLGTDAGPQPLIAAYRRRSLEVVTHLLDKGHRRAMDLVEALTTDILPPTSWRDHDPSGRTAVDLDTPAEVSSALRQRSISIRVISTDRPSTDRDDMVVVEEPLEIRAHGPGQEPRTLVTTMRTPGHDVDLAVGWLFSEGLLAVGDIVDVSLGDPVALARPDDQVTIQLASPIDLEAAAHRHTTATASCGICGRAAIDELALRCAGVDLAALTDPPLAFDLLASLPGQLQHNQAIFGHTGGLHATGLFDRHGSLVTLREDIGRHNALDAAIGARVIDEEVPLDTTIAVLSGRVGFELAVKAAMAAIPILGAVGAPTDLAVRTADRFGITLIGFLRNGRGNIYTHPHRIAEPTP